MAGVRCVGAGFEGRGGEGREGAAAANNTICATLALHSRRKVAESIGAFIS